MEINRNHYFMAGLIVLFLGIQFRVVDTYVLNDKCSQFISERLNKAGSSAADFSPLSISAPPSSFVVNREIRPPNWLGWAFLSVGGVLVLHSLAMSRPD